MTITKVPPPTFSIGSTVPRRPGDASLQVKISQEFNRWLLTLTSFINSSGLIPGNNVDLTTNPTVESLQNDIVVIDGEISTLQTNIATLQGQVTTLQGQVTTLQGQVTTLQSQVAALQALPQVRNGSGAPASTFGNVNDWYADIGGNHIYVKTNATTWQQIV